MSTQLVDALRTLDLKPGQTRLVQVDGEILEIRKPPTDGEPSAYTGHEMLMPSFDIPRHPVGTVKAYPSKLPPFDPPILPEEFDGFVDEP